MSKKGYEIDIAFPDKKNYICSQDFFPKARAIALSTLNFLDGRHLPKRTL
jgi:hypothetical protein